MPGTKSVNADIPDRSRPKGYRAMRDTVQGLRLHFLGGQPLGGVELAKQEDPMQLALWNWQEVDNYLRRSVELMSRHDSDRERGCPLDSSQRER